MKRVTAIDFTEREMSEKMVILSMVQQQWWLFPDLALYVQHLFHLFSVTFGAFVPFETERMSQGGSKFCKDLSQTTNFCALLEVLVKRREKRDSRVNHSETERVVKLIANIMSLCFHYKPWTTINQLEAMRSEDILNFYTTLIEKK